MTAESREATLPLILLSGMFGAVIVAANLLAGVKLESLFSTVIAGIPIEAIVPAGTIAYAITFPITDIVDEVYGKKKALWIVWAGLLAEIVMLVMVVIDFYIPPLTKDMQALYQKAFYLQPRIVLASIIAYLVSQHHDVWFFLKIREITKGRFLWLRNNLSTMLSQLYDTTIFITIAFAGAYEWDVVLFMILGTWVVKLIIALLDTPFVYLGVHLLKRYGRS